MLSLVRLVSVAVVALHGLSSFIDTVAVERERRDASTWTITTLGEKPYLSVTTANPTKNEDYEGFIPDMMAKISNKLSQKYKLHLVADGRYGTVDRGVWSGMIGEVINGKADIAAAALTISDARRAVVDFTKPFMTFGTVILIRKTNGTDEIKTFHDLINKGNFKFGVVQHGATEQLIEQSTNQDLKRLKDHLDHVDSQIKGVERVRKENFAFIIEANTAEYWTKQAPCDLVEIKVNENDLQKRDYAFAVKKGSELTAKLNQVITDMDTNGELNELKKKWWKDECKNSAGGKPLMHSALIMLIASGVLSLLVKPMKY